MSLLLNWKAAVFASAVVVLGFMPFIIGLVLLDVDTKMDFSFVVLFGFLLLPGEIFLGVLPAMPAAPRFLFVGAISWIFYYAMALIYFRPKHLRAESGADNAAG